MRPVLRARSWAALLALQVMLGSLAAVAAPVPGEPAAGWPGVDESVIEKVAAEAGRTPRPLLFEMEGDLGLFLFLCAGIVGGSIFGYCFRMLFVERIDERPSHAQSRVV